MIQWIFCIIDLLEDKMTGILVFLEDESKKALPSTDQFMQRIRNACFKKSVFDFPSKKQHDLQKDSQSCFIIRHFAKSVDYSAVK